MGAARLYGLRDLRRRWRTFVALGVVAAVAGGLVLASWAGARRTHTSIDRFADTTRFPHLVGPIARADEAIWDQIATLPEIEAAGRLTGLALMSQNDFNAGTFTLWGVDVKGNVGSVIARDLILRGRRADAQSPDEVTLRESIARKWGLDVGDTLRLMSFVGGTFQAAVQTDEFAANGPLIELKVVGVTRNPEDVLRNANGVSINALTPAFLRAHPDIDTFVQLAFYRLRGGVAAAPAFIERVQPLTNQTPKANPDDAETTFEVADLKGQIGDALNVAENGQLAFALIGAAATLLTLAIATSRLARHGDREALSALGMSTRAQVVAGFVPLFVTAAIAFVGSMAVSYLGSRLFMPSLARRADPDLGPRLDPLVVAAALAGAAVLLAIGALSVARHDRHSVPRPAVAWLRVGGASALLGMSLTRLGRSGRAGAARGAMVGVIVALVGLAGGAIYVRSLDDLNGDRARWGLDADFTATVPDDFGARVLAKPIVDAAVTLHYGFTFINGSPVHTVAFDPIVGRITPELLQGRLPVGADEIALSSRFFDGALRLGSTVSVLDVDGNPTDIRVVGEAIAPPLDGRGSLSNGAVVTAGAYAGLRVDQASNTTAVRQLPGVGRDETVAAIGADVKDVFGVEHPAAISNLAAMRGVIVSLIALLAFLGLAGASLSFVSSIRRGRANIAVGRAMGMTRRAVRGSLVAFVGGVIAVGALIATIVGYIGGVQLWRIQSESLGVRVVTVVPWATIVVALALGILVAVTLGAFIGDRFGRARSFDVLRAE